MSSRDDLLALAAKLNKAYARDVIMSAAHVPAVRRVPLNVPVVDYVMGGGVPINRIIEFWGPFSSGKSFLSYRAIAEFQHTEWGTVTPGAFEELEYVTKKVKGEGPAAGSAYTLKAARLVEGVKIKDPQVRTAVLLDYENTYEPEWGEKQGINNAGLIHVVPDRPSEMVDMAEAFLTNEDVSLVVIDSAGASGSDAEVDASMEDNQMGANARFWNKAMRKLASAMNRNPNKIVTLIIINRPYSKVGVVYGSPEVIANGSGIAFAKAVSVGLHPVGSGEKKKVDGVETIVGKNVKVKCVKNKTARPFLEGTFYHSFIDEPELGLRAGHTDELGQWITLGLQCGVIVRKGAYYGYGKINIMGRESFLAAIMSKGLEDSLSTEVYAKLYGK